MKINSKIGSKIGSVLFLLIIGVSSAHATLTVTQIAAANYATCAIVNSGYAVKCWGNGSQGVLGNNSTVNSRSAVIVSGLPANKKIRQLVGIGFSFYAIAEEPNSNVGLYAWGANDNYQLGIPDRLVKYVATKVSGLPNRGLTYVAAGSYGAYAIVNTNGLKEIYVAGSNYCGELGPAATSMEYFKTSFMKLPNSATNVKFVGGGGLHSCYVTDDNQVFCRGANDFGQLGRGVTAPGCNPLVSSLAAVQGLPNGTISELDVNAQTSCVRYSSGAAYCWGSSSGGIFGDANLVSQNLAAYPVTYDNYPSPIQVYGGARVDTVSYNKIKQLSLRDQGSCVVASASNVRPEAFCTGASYYGMVGKLVGMSINGFEFPVRTLVVQISYFPNSNPQVYQYPQFALANAVNPEIFIHSPFAISLHSTGYPANSGLDADDEVVQVATGSYHNCFLTDKSKVYCAGLNASGQLGKNDDPNRSYGWGPGADYSPTDRYIDRTAPVVGL